MVFAPTVGVSIGPPVISSAGDPVSEGAVFFPLPFPAAVLFPLRL